MLCNRDPCTPGPRLSRVYSHPVALSSITSHHIHISSLLPIPTSSLGITMIPPSPSPSPFFVSSVRGC